MSDEKRERSSGGSGEPAGGGWPYRGDDLADEGEDEFLAWERDLDGASEVNAADDGPEGVGIVELPEALADGGFGEVVDDNDGDGRRLLRYRRLICWSRWLEWS